MNTLKKLITSLFILTLSLNVVAPAYAATYEYVEGYGMVEVQGGSDYPTGVNNDGLFGLSAEDFRAICSDTGGDWDVVNGRHVCYCDNGEEFNFPFGCGFDVPTDWPSDMPSDWPSDWPTFPDGYTPDGYQPDGYYPDSYYPQPANDRYNDLYGHWAQYYILELTNRGILQGYPDGYFRPDQPVTRAEMLKMVMKASQLPTHPGDEDTDRFFVDLEPWQAPWVNAAYRMDIVEGYSAPVSGVRLFKPNQNVIRAESVKMVLASFGRRPFDYDYRTFRDVSGWMLPWVEDGFRIGLFDAEKGDYFRPGDATTRAEAAQFVYRMMVYAGDIQ